MKRRTVVVGTLVAGMLAVTSVTAAHALMAAPGAVTRSSLGKCPVMTDQDASRDYSATYKGKTYYFCCSDCVKAFKQHPSKYVK